VNDRIRELAEQASAQPTNLPQYVTLDWKKFAELIVRECAKVASNADLEDVDGGDSAVLRSASEQIKKHFGVES
jgi:hypothetical protein